ncbi:DNA-binding protein HEXBP-like [Halyomorpha halys]|uniref:DNA-binding protein HEXBP-like n=1 Tax=Halyomorpha halys TaxID=286706 RepID=UPI0006D4FACB
MGRERRPNQGRIRNREGKEDRKCHGCEKVGHLVAHCPRTRCFECGNEGHIARQCPYMYKKAETGPGDPMEINFPCRRKRREDYRPSESSSETSEASEASGTVGEGRGGRSNKPPSSRLRRVSEGRRSRPES